MKFLLQSLSLLLSFVLVFIWQQTPLSGYTIQIIGFLTIIYLISSFVTSKKIKQISLGGPLEMFVLNIIILLFVFATGGISSNFFFLLYFLLFALVFVFQPETIVSFLIGIILLFLPDTLRDDVMNNFIRIGSLILVSPLAYFFGKGYQKASNQKKETEKNKTKETIDEIE